jgi:hypothetical protein
MFDCEDEDGVAEVVETNAVVADAEAELGRLNILQPFHISFSRGRESIQPVKYPQRRRPIYGPQIVPGLIFPYDLSTHH